MKDELLYRDECYRVIGACMAVHQDKGNGFAEPVYQDALEIELELSDIPFDPQRNYQIARPPREFRRASAPRAGANHPQSHLIFASFAVFIS